VVPVGCAGDRYLDEVDRAAGIADRLQQLCDEIAVHGADIAAGTVLQHAEAIDHDIDLVILNQPCQRRRIHRQHRHFEIEGAYSLRRRESPSESGHAKAARAQIVGDKSPDQAGRAEQQDFRRFTHALT